MRILLVEDNDRLAELVCAGLKAGGFAVDWVPTIHEAESALASVDYQAAVVDMRLPDGDGLDLVKSLRRSGSNLSVLVLTARDGVEDRVNGLNAGADDYVLKPFAMEELLARVRALLRRPGEALGVRLSCGNLLFDTVSREVRINDERIHMPRRETEMLERLLRRTGRVVPKRILEDGLYGFDDEGSTNSVEVLMSRLRKRLQQSDSGVVIHTLRGIGYLIDEAPAEEAPIDDAEEAG